MLRRIQYLSFVITCLPTLLLRAQPLTDPYPSREALKEFSYTVCAQHPPKEGFNENLEAYLLQITTSTLGKKVSKHQVLKESLDAYYTFTFSEEREGVFQVRYSEKGMSVHYRKSLKAIEPIFFLELSATCTEESHSITYYNTNLFPVWREFTNSNTDRIQVLNLKPLVQKSLLETPSDALRVGIIDSGVDYNHPQLMAKMRPMIGVDLTTQDDLPYDYTTTFLNEVSAREFSHGTAVADILSRNLNVHIIPVRIYSRLDLAGKAIEYLARQGVRIINLSLGTDEPREWAAYKAALKRHPEILVIVAAGNKAQDIDQHPTFPASYSLPNQLVVASIDNSGELSSFSNFGSQHVDIAANGNKISAAKADGGTWAPSGTSFAAPQITHLAAEILIQHPNLSMAELKRAILTRAQKSQQTVGKVKYGVINKVPQSNLVTGFSFGTLLPNY